MQAKRKKRDDSMNDKQKALFYQQAQSEVTELSKRLDKVIDEYLVSSAMPKNQAIVNVGRSLNAIHVAWIANLGAELETRHKRLQGEEMTDMELANWTVSEAKKRTVDDFSRTTKEL